MLAMAMIQSCGRTIGSKRLFFLDECCHRNRSHVNSIGNSSFFSTRVATHMRKWDVQIPIKLCDAYSQTDASDDFEWYCVKGPWLVRCSGLVSVKLIYIAIAIDMNW